MLSSRIIVLLWMIMIKIINSSYQIINPSVTGKSKYFGTHLLSFAYGGNNYILVTEEKYSADDGLLDIYKVDANGISSRVT